MRLLTNASNSLQHLTIRRGKVGQFSFDNIPNLKTLDLSAGNLTKKNREKEIDMERKRERESEREWKRDRK